MRKKYKYGQIIGECIFVKELAAVKYNKNAIRRAIFKCKCGKEFEASIGHVKNNTVKSCGCHCNANYIKKHGGFGKPEYNIWCAMKNRCISPNNIGYENYGGRGIKVCDRWLGENGFVNFYDDIGKRPSTEHTLERIDNNGNYEPSNCRWATMAEQCANRRNSRKFTYNDKTLHISGWARVLGITPTKLWKILVYKKIPFESAYKEYKNKL